VLPPTLRLLVPIFEIAEKANEMPNITFLSSLPVACPAVA